MVELRKRKTPPPAPVRPAKKKAAPKSTKTEETVVEKAAAAVADTVEAVKETVTEAVTGASNGGDTAPAGSVKVGDAVTLAGFGGEVETHEGVKTTLADLVEKSKSGVVLFTYPKASTPGCTKQVCFFRDSYTPLTATGYDIYGLSNDSPKANTTFKTKQKLPYPLLCDPSRTLISAIGLNSAKGTTTRGIFIVDKSGKVLAAEAGSPDGTLKIAQKILASDSTAPAEVKEKDTTAAADTAGDVADTAEKLDAGKA